MPLVYQREIHKREQNDLDIAIYYKTLVFLCETEACTVIEEGSAVVQIFLIHLRLCVCIITVRGDSVLCPTSSALLNHSVCD